MKNNDKWRHFDVTEKDPDESPVRRWTPIAGAVVLVLVIGGAGAALISKMAGTGAPAQPTIQQISIVLPPPPPPPPPKMEEPEPEIEELEIEEPEPVADDSSEAPPGEELGLDADGVAGSDGFGLKARKGGRGLLGGDPFAWYAGVLQRDLQALLSNDDSIRGLGDYAVVVSISLSDDGYIGETQLLSGSNNPELDAALRRALSNGLRLSRQPPDDLPQPIRLRISSRS
jgi:periplasmic protein TonB